jgi:hypothetical protein
VILLAEFAIAAEPVTMKPVVAESGTTSGGTIPLTKPAARSAPRPAWWTAYHAERQPEPDRIYRIECVVLERGEDGKDIVISRPTVATIPHQSAQVQIAQATPLVTGMEPAAEGKTKPTITVVTSGISMVMKLAPDQAGRATFDISVEQTAIESVDVAKLPDGTARQSARIGGQTTRVIGQIELGKKVTVGLDDKDATKSKRRAEFTVTETMADRAAE